MPTLNIISPSPAFIFPSLQTKGTDSVPDMFRKTRFFCFLCQRAEIIIDSADRLSSRRLIEAAPLRLETPGSARDTLVTRACANWSTACIYSTRRSRRNRRSIVLRQNHSSRVTLSAHKPSGSSFGGEKEVSVVCISRSGYEGKSSTK